MTIRLHHSGWEVYWNVTPFFCAENLSDVLYVPPFLRDEKVLIVCHRLTKNYSVVTKIIGYFQESHPG